jgi:hypothetical protein
VPQVIPHQLPADGAKRFVDRRDLREDVGAVAILSDHLLESTRLAFDSPQTLEVARLHVRVYCERAPGFPRRVADLAAALRVCAQLERTTFDGRRHHSS